MLNVQSPVEIHPDMTAPVLPIAIEKSVTTNEIQKSSL
jgi:hypothetical protein